ncbi:MAG: transglycosylase SLT domain-containing protein [Stenotrophobium sp.]
MQALRDLLLPFLSILAVLGCVYLISQKLPGSGDPQPRHKFTLRHHSPAAPANSTAPSSTIAVKPAASAAASRRAAISADTDNPDQNEHHWTARYDEHFRKYTKRYFGVDFDWRWFKAQAIVESTLNPHAHNESGATGLMQIKPMTFKEIRKHDPEIHSLRSPRWNIAAGIFYVHTLYDKAAIKVFPDSVRLYLSFASYNAGYTRMLRVIRRMPPENDGWRDTLRNGPLEARNYVERIITVKSKI